MSVFADACDILRMRMRATYKIRSGEDSIKTGFGVFAIKGPMSRHHLVCNCSGVSVAEACGVMQRSAGEPTAGPPSTTSEAVRKKVLQIKAETEENKICADCKRFGGSRSLYADARIF